jgi:hypothetical protein
MPFTKPGLNEVFTITSTPEWPEIKFETDITAAHTWRWTVCLRHVQTAATTPQAAINGTPNRDYKLRRNSQRPRPS